MVAGQLPFDRSVLVPGGEDPRAVLGDRDRELEMGRERAVGRVHGPVVVADPDLGTAGEG